MPTIQKLLLPAAAAAVVSTTIWYSGISLVWIVAVVAAWLLNGFIATYEDDIPGGLNNPDGTSTPAYVQTFGRIAKMSCAVLCGTIAIVILATASQGVMDWTHGTLFAITSVSLGVAVIHPRRIVQWLALLFAFIVFVFSIWLGPVASNTTMQPPIGAHWFGMTNGGARAACG